MTTNELISIVSTITNRHESTVGDTVRTAFAVVADAIADQEVVRLAGLGRLQLRQKGISRLLHGDQDGAAKRTTDEVEFQPAKRLRSEINARAGAL